MKRTELRYPAAKRLDSDGPSTRNSTGEIKNSEAFSFRTSEGGVTIDLRGSRVLILEGVLETANMNVVLKRLWLA